MGLLYIRWLQIVSLCANPEKMSPRDDVKSVVQYLGVENQSILKLYFPIISEKKLLNVMYSIIGVLNVV